MNLSMKDLEGPIMNTKKRKGMMMYKKECS